MIYLAAPYNDYDSDIVSDRMEKIYKLISDLMKKDIFIVSPLFMHEILIRHDLPTAYTYWEKYCMGLLKRCDGMIVYKLEGWETSGGVLSEIAFCKTNNIPITYID